MTTYFVSSEIGSDHNAGTSATSALATLQAAEALVKPGDTVEVMNGTYTGPGYGNVLTVTTSGTASAPITFEAAPGATPVINSSGCWQGILIQASYIVINGFTVVGDAANYTLSQAIAGYSPGNANLDGNGIGVSSPDGTFVPNHITIENNTVYNEPGGGIYTMGADYVQILNNVVHDNTHWSVYGNSGISIAASANSDTNSGVHDIISGNVSYNNQNLVQENYSGAILDGEGIILDTNPGFVGEILVQGNTTYGNSGPGIESFLTDNAVITNNTTHGDLQNATLASQGGRTEIWINQSNNNTVTNNTLTSVPLPLTPLILSFSPDTGVADRITDANILTLTGTAATNDTVTVTDGSTTIGTTTSNASGQWTLTTAALANGIHRFTATTTDGGTSAALAVTIDMHVPAAPVVSSFSPNTGGIDTTNQLTLTGTAEANSTVTVFYGSTALGTAVANASGAWTYPSGILPNGVHTFTFTATATDGAGVTGPASAPLSVTVNAPVTTNLVANGAFEAGNLTGWTMGGNDGLFLGGPQIFITNNAQSGQFAADLGSVGSDGTLSQNILTTAGQNYTVQFWLANASGGPNDFTAKWNGQTLLALTNAAAQGYTEYTYNVVATAGISNLEFDARQDPSDWRLDSISVTAVGSQPSAPPPSTPVPPVNAPVTTNLVANGAFEAGNLTGWTMGGNDGLFLGGPQIFITNTAQSGQFAADLGSVGSDGTLSQNILTTAGQNYTVQFWLANASGGPNDFTAKWNGQTLLALTNAAAQGYTEYTYNVVATAGISNLEFDARQDPSDWRLDSISVTAVGSQPSAPPPSTPVPPVIASFSPDTGVVGDGITDPAVLTLTGTALAGSTVTVFDGTQQLGTAPVSASGTWSYTTSALPDGKHTLTATDTNAGQTSAPSSALSVTIDTVAPAQPKISSFSPDTTPTADGHTTATTIALSGTGEANSTITVFDGTRSLGPAPVNSSGAWSIAASNLVVGSHNFTATDTDAAGNTSVASAPLAVTIDAFSSPTPPAPVIASFSHDSGVKGDGITNDKTLSLTGTAGANDTVNVFDGTTLLGTAPVNSSGNWSYTTLALPDGRHSFTSTDTNAAGNTSAPSSALVVTVDTVAPARPTVSSFSPDTAPTGDGQTTATNLTLTGMGEASSTIQVFDGTSLLGTAPVNAVGNWSTAANNLAVGSHSFSATDADAAGNTSVASVQLAVTILSQLMAGQTGQTGSSGGGTTVSPPPSAPPDPVTVANPFGLAHS